MTKLRKRPQRIAFTVSFDLPPGASPDAAHAYIRNALLAECGLRNPLDPMHQFDNASVCIVEEKP